MKHSFTTRLALLCAFCVLLLPAAWAQTEATYTSGGVAITVDCYHATTTGTHPVIVYLYGLDGMQLFPASYVWMSEWFASQGYDVYIVHYFDRTGSSFPNPVAVVMDSGLWVQTINDGIAWAAKLPTTNPKQIGVMGLSLGAFLGLAVAQENLTVAALVDWSGGLITSNPTHLPPTLVIHGAEDPIVPVASAYAVVAALQKLGVPYEVQIYPNEGHAYFQINDELDALNRSLTFFNQYLK